MDKISITAFGLGLSFLFLMFPMATLADEPSQKPALRSLARESESRHLAGPSYKELSDLASLEQTQVFRAVGLNDWDGAKTHSQKLLKLRRRARALAQEGDSARDKHWADFWLARAFERNGDFVKAEEYLLKAKVSAKDEERRVSLGFSLVELSTKAKQWSRAVHHLDEIRKHELTLIQKIALELKHGELEMETEDLAAAARRLEKVSEILSGLPQDKIGYRATGDFWSAMARLAWKQKNPQGAREFRLKALENRVLAHKALMGETK